MRQEHTKFCVCSLAHSQSGEDAPYQLLSSAGHSFLFGDSGPSLAKTSHSSAHLHIGRAACGESSTGVRERAAWGGSMWGEQPPHLGTLAPCSPWPTTTPICGQQPLIHHGAAAKITNSLPSREPKAHCMRETVISPGRPKPEALHPEEPSHLTD